VKFRNLRIAWSVAWTLACALLIALWVRSYSWFDMSTSTSRHALSVTDGWLFWDTPIAAVLKPKPAAPRPPVVKEHFGFVSLSLSVATVQPIDRFALMRRGKALPFWVPVLLAGTLAAVVWRHWKFSLRTLLIVTTLVALVLGLAVYMANH